MRFIWSTERNRKKQVESIDIWITWYLFRFAPKKEMASQPPQVRQYGFIKKLEKALSQADFSKIRSYLFRCYKPVKNPVSLITYRIFYFTWKHMPKTALKHMKLQSKLSQKESRCRRKKASIRHPPQEKCSKRLLYLKLKITTLFWVM